MASLNTVLKINAASCLLFGCFFLIIPDVVSNYIGSAPIWVLRVVGGGLVLNGLHLAIASRRNTPKKREIINFSLGDLLWWLCTFGLIATGQWITTAHGVITAIAIGVVVANLGVLQLWNLGKQRSGHTDAQHFAAITTSWMTLPHWVKIWLFILNGAFLWSIFHWSDGFAKITLLAFVATGPLLMGQLAFDGGLRRILGLAHLVPWAPFLVWLLWAPHPEHAVYAQVLTGIVAMCLAFDIYDIIRFFNGDRAIIGRETQR